MHRLCSSEVTWKYCLWVPWYIVLWEIRKIGPAFVWIWKLCGWLLSFSKDLASPPVFFRGSFHSVPTAEEPSFLLSFLSEMLRWISIYKTNENGVAFVKGKWWNCRAQRPLHLSPWICAFTAESPGLLTAQFSHHHHWLCGPGESLLPKNVV